MDVFNEQVSDYGFLMIEVCGNQKNSMGDGDCKKNVCVK